MEGAFRINFRFGKTGKDRSWETEKGEEEETITISSSVMEMTLMEGYSLGREWERVLMNIATIFPVCTAEMTYISHKWPWCLITSSQHLY